MDLADEKRRTDLVEFYERFNKFDEKSQCIFRCGAGVNSFHIDPYGFLHICALVRNPGYDLKHGSFRDGWDTFLPGIRAQTRKEGNKCADCNLHLLCGQCPGWSQLEHGDLERPVEYLCQVGHLRGQLLGMRNEKGKPIHTEV